MTLAEQIIGGILVAGISVLLGLIVGNKRKVTTEEFERHRESPIPHPACPVHDKWLKDIDKKIDSLDDKLDALLER